VSPGPAGTKGLFRFGDDFVLDADACMLRRSDRALKLERIPTEVLLLLVARRGEVVSRDRSSSCLSLHVHGIVGGHAVNIALRSR
jgi:DNA-binding response OmpR family regulator